MLCIGSTAGGALGMSVKAKMLEAVLTTAGDDGVHEIQKIDIGTDIIVEHQVNLNTSAFVGLIS